MRNGQFESLVLVRMLCTDFQHKYWLLVNCVLIFPCEHMNILTPLHWDVIQSTPSHGRNVHFCEAVGFGSGHSASFSTSILPSFLLKHLMLLLWLPSPHNLLHCNDHNTGNTSEGIFGWIFRKAKNQKLTPFHAPVCHCGQTGPELHAFSVAGLFPAFCKHCSSSRALCSLK